MLINFIFRTSAVFVKNFYSHWQARIDFLRKRTKRVCLPKSFSQQVEQLSKAFYVSKAYPNRSSIGAISKISLPEYVKGKYGSVFAYKNRLFVFAKTEETREFKRRS